VNEHSSRPATSPSQTTGASARADAGVDGLATLMLAIAVGKYRVPRADAESLVQDVFATYLVQQDEVRAPRAYLIGGICQASRAYWRKREASERLFVPLDVQLAADPLVPRRSVEEQVSDRLALAATLTKLNARCRHVLRMFFIEGFSATEIGTSLETTQAYAFRLVHICRDKARRIYIQLSSGARHEASKR
jgi:RNA polymerase sigma factor (sigma-70 family)